MPNLRRVLVVFSFLPWGTRLGRDKGVRAFLQALAAGCEVSFLSAGSPPEGFRFLRAVYPNQPRPLDIVEMLDEPLAGMIAHTAANRACDAIIFIDHPRLRAVLDRVRQAAQARCILAIFPEAASGEDMAMPLSPASPHEVWCLEKALPGLQTAGLLPDFFHVSENPDAAWIRRRLRDLGTHPAGAGGSRGLASIIVPCCNNLRYTKECLRSVARCTRKPYELVVVDNGSTDGTPAYFESLRRSGAARVIRNPRNLGFAGAVNQGMRAAQGDFLVWLNNDAIVTPHWLERLIACARRAPWVAAAGPLTNDRDGRFIPKGIRRPRALARYSAAVSLRNAGRARLTHRLLGFCFLLKREAMDRVGPLDERFGLGLFEDYDYCLRLRQAGYELAVAEDVFVYHYWCKTLESLGNTALQLKANKTIWVDKWCRRALEFLENNFPPFRDEQSPVESAQE